MLSEQQKHIIIKPFKPYNPGFIGWFGSYARNEETENSDIDLLIELNHPKLNLFDIGRIDSELEGKLNKKFDLAFKHKLKHLLQKNSLNYNTKLFKA